MPQADDDAQYRIYAGEVLWPTTPDVLTDTTRCPACLAPLTDIVCRTCGLNLGHPAATRLASLSNAASAALAARVAVIGRIRFETNESTRTTTTPAAEPVAQLTAPVTTSAVVVPQPATAPPPATTQHDGPRRSSVQVALLVAGVSLLSIFAIFFLVYAFINYGIVWRSVIIASITVAAFVSASLLRRRSLNASAEGLAVFALVLVYLDAYALRANDFFGLAAAGGALYWGCTVTLASIGFIAWHRMSRVRAASIVGWTGLTFGAGILASGLFENAEPATRIFATVTAMAAAALAHTLIPHHTFAGTLERMLVLTTAALSLPVAYLVGWLVAPDTDWGGAIAGAIVAVVALVHAVTAAVGRAPTAQTRVFGNAFAAIGGVAGASAVAVGAARIAVDDVRLAIFVPVVCAAVVALALDAATRRSAVTPLQRPAGFATWGGSAVLALIALLPLAFAAGPVAAGVARGVRRPWLAGTDFSLAMADANSPLAVLALAGVVLLAAAVWAMTGAIRGRGAALAWGASVVLVLAAAQLPTVWMTLGGWLALAAIAVVLLLRSRRSADTTAFRACLGSVITVSTTLLFVVGWGSLDTWAATTTATVVVLLTSRIVVGTARPRAVLLGVAVGVALYGAAAASRHLTWNQRLSQTIDDANLSMIVGLGAAVILAAAAVGYRRVITALDRRTVFWIAGAASGAAAVLSFTLLTTTNGADQVGLLLPPFSTSLASGLVLFGALALWVGLRSNGPLRPERIVASVALAPVLFWMVDSFARVLGLGEFAQSVVPISAAVLASAGALVVTLLRASVSPRWAREAGIALVAVPAVVTAIVQDSESGWLVLVLAAVTALLLSISADGLFGSASPRRQVGWLALALATTGLWWRLSSNRVDALELYVLPLAVALLLVALLLHRAWAKTDGTAGSRVAPLVGLAGLLIGILPLAANSITGDPLRPLVIFAVSAILLLAGSLIIARAGLQPYLDAMALAGGVGVLVTAGGRALLAPGTNLVPDGWLLVLLAVLAVATFGQARQRPDAGKPWREQASQGLAVVGVLALLVVEVDGFGDGDLGPVRAIAAVTMLSALHIVAFSTDRAPLTRFVALAAISGAAGAAAVGWATDALEFIEIGSVPIALALIVTGRIQLADEPAARSWRPLGLGIAVLLVPSLLATATAPELWRLVGLGLVAVTVLIVGAVRRLQAPFVLGLAVALIHGFATFAPEIRAVYESQEWWLWAGLAGVVLVLLAIRYEKRIQNLRDVVLRIAALR